MFGKLDVAGILACEYLCFCRTILKRYESAVCCYGSAAYNGYAFSFDIILSRIAQVFKPFNALVLSRNIQFQL